MLRLFQQAELAYVDGNSSAAMLVAKISAGIAPEVNLREHASHTPPPCEYSCQL